MRVARLVRLMFLVNGPKSGWMSVDCASGALLWQRADCHLPPRLLRNTCRHGKNLNSDAWKALQLWKHTANQEHPFRCAGDVLWGWFVLYVGAAFLTETPSHHAQPLLNGQP